MSSSRVYQQNPAHEVVNLRHAGCIEGAGISPADMAINDQILEGIANAGKSIYAPGGRWEFTATPRWNFAQNVSITGDGWSSIIAQMDDQTLLPLFRMEDCEHISCQDIMLQGPNFVSVTEGNSSRAFYILRSNYISITNANVCGWPSEALDLHGCSGINISGNMLWFNENTASTSTDIAIRGQQGLNRYCTVVGNVCLSNSNSNILFSSPVEGATISSNVCITCDKDLNEITTYDGMSKKDSITVPYNLDEIDADTVDTLMVTISDNVIKNCRWSGIYCNNNVNVDGLEGGIKGTITGNTIHNTALERGNVAAGKIGGIMVEQFQQVVIANNTISKINNTLNPTDWFAGIQVSARDEFTQGLPCVATIANNTITNSEGEGIRIKYKVNELKVTGNVVTDIHRYPLSVASSNPIINLDILDNTFRQTASGPKLATDMIWLGVDTGRVRISRNKFQEWQIPDTNHELLQIAYRDAEITDNLFEGIAASGVSGITIVDPVTVGRLSDLRLSNNKFRNLDYGITNTTSSASTNNGPVLMSNCTFEGMLNGELSSGVDNFIYHGDWHGDTCTIRHSGVPSAGNWLQGDRLEIQAPTSGNPTFYTCITPGTAGAAVWQPEGTGGGGGPDNVGMDYVLPLGVVGSSQTINFASSNHQSFTINASAAIGFSDPLDPQLCYLHITNATGATDIFWPSNLDQEPVLNTEPGSYTFVIMYFNGSDYLLLS